MPVLQVWISTSVPKQVRPKSAVAQSLYRVFSPNSHGTEQFENSDQLSQLPATDTDYCIYNCSHVNTTHTRMHQKRPNGKDAGPENQMDRVYVQINETPISHYVTPYDYSKIIGPFIYDMPFGIIVDDYVIDYHHIST